MKYKITKLLKSDESKLWQADCNVHEEVLEIGESIERVFNIPNPRIESGENKFLVVIDFEIIKWDKELPCYLHEVKIKVGDKQYKGIISGHKGKKRGTELPQQQKMFPGHSPRLSILPVEVSSPVFT